MGIAGAAIAGVATTLIGTGISVYGAQQQAGAQQAAANYQAQVARNNSIVASQNATAVTDQATANAVSAARLGSQRIGAQRAALAANGVTLDSGSALDVQSATATNTGLDEDAKRYEGARQAYGYESQGVNYNAQAGLDTLTGQNAEAAGGINAASSLLSGASQVSSRWAAYKQVGGVAVASPQYGGLY